MEGIVRGIGRSCETVARQQAHTHAPALSPQAKEALNHPYFDDLDKEAVDALENPDLEDAGEPDF